MQIAMRQQDGYSLIELLIVVALVGILGAVVVPVRRGMVNRSQVDSSVTGLVMVLESARNRAVSERRNVQLNFEGLDEITVERHEVPGPATTIVERQLLAEKLQFRLFEGLPDTPDGFGNGEAVTFTGPGPIMFTSDGSLIDSSGDVVNGSIFLGREGDTTSARALTIYGMTGLIQTWSWSGSEWTQ
jgi:prepilin-type N-terminal cleavage/methylation domain-containing protein